MILRKTALSVFVFSGLFLFPLFCQSAPLKLKVECSMDLYTVTYQQTPMGKIEKTSLIEKKTIQKELPEAQDDGEIVSLDGQLGGFYVQAQVNSPEKIVARITLGDADHRGEWWNSGATGITATLTDLSKLRKMFVACKMAP